MKEFKQLIKNGKTDSIFESIGGRYLLFKGPRSFERSIEKVVDGQH